MPRLSAGRVQSVATRLIVDRERERIAFRSASYWDLDAILDAGPDAQPPLFPLGSLGLASDGWPRAAISTAAVPDHEGHDQLVLLDEGKRRLCGLTAVGPL